MHNSLTTQIEGFSHRPVLPREVMEFLRVGEDALVVDATLGLGGHSSLIADVLGTKGRLVAFDQDPKAIELARSRLEVRRCRVDIVQSNFSQMASRLKELGIREVDGALFDLGVSSMQLDDPQRGFSFRFDGPLDMRMDPGCEISARDLVNSASKEELSEILLKYGEERFHQRIATAIVRARSAARLETTGQLRDVIAKAVPYRFAKDGLHPATRSFQALRIAVNREMDVLEGALQAAFSHLKLGGRMCVISFHSLEDRIVKEMFRKLSDDKRAELLTRKPLRPTQDEIAGNPRSRSARLRAVERLA